MSLFKINLSQKHKLLLGFTTLKGRCSRKLYWACFAGALLLLFLPWGCVVAGLIASYHTLAQGDEMQIPLWAWITAVGAPLAACLLAKMMASRICTQWYLRTHTGRAEKLN